MQVSATTKPRVIGHAGAACLTGPTRSVVRVYTPFEGGTQGFQSGAQTAIWLGTPVVL